MTDTLTDPNSTLSNRFYDAAYTQTPDEEVAQKDKVARATPGIYFLQVGKVEATFKPAETKSGANGEYTTRARVEAIVPFTIVSGEHDDLTHAGKPLNKYYRVNTLPLKGQNFSPASAMLKVFEQELTGDADVDIATLENLSGLTTPKAIFVGLQGRLGAGPNKGREYIETATGRRYLKETDFRLGDVKAKVDDYIASGGTWAERGYLVDGEFTLERPNENVEHQVVWADLQPTPWSWKGRKA